MALGMKKYSAQEATEKIQRYCAYQERNHKEIRSKLFGYGLYQNEVEEIIVHLITSGFLNEERYAKAFVGGKFRMKKWGKIKITHALEGHGLTSNCIKSGLKEIDTEEYVTTLHNLLLKKNDQLEEENIFVRRDKLSTYAIQKGYEPELVWKIIRSILPD
jgi:regulatory protein